MKQSNFKYRADIDGLRCLAVVPVIIYHSGIDVFSGGFAGVDIFFVISGYLITTILLSELNNNHGNIDIIDFYERRARRIMPLLFFIIFCSLPWAWFLLTPYDLKEFSQSIVVTPIFLTNVFFWLKSGYFDPSVEFKPLIHFWSLSVEEQFYLFFPLVLWGLYKAKLNIKIYLLGITLISFLFCEYYSTQQSSLNYYFILSRAWELLMGALCAFYTLKVSKVKYSNELSLTGFALIIFTYIFIDSSYRYPSYYTLLPVIGTCLILLFSSSTGIVGKILTRKYFVNIGLISYSLYLWHQPIFAFGKIYFGDKYSLFISIQLIVLTLLLSIFTYFFVEQPFRNRKHRIFNRQFIFISTLSLSSIVIIIGVIGHLGKGFPNRAPVFEMLAQNYGLNEQCNGNLNALDECKTVDNPEIVLWGDSFAMHLALGLDSAYPEEGLYQATLSGCPPIVGFDEVSSQRGMVGCKAFNNSVMAYLSANEGVGFVILSSTFGQLQHDNNFTLFQNTINKLNKMGLRVIIVGPTPSTGDDFGHCFVAMHRNKKGFENCNFKVEDIRPSFEYIMIKLQSLENVETLINLQDVICDREVCEVSINSIILYRDWGHLSKSGSIEIFKRIMTVKKGTNES